MSKRGQVYLATMKLTEEVAGRNVLNRGKKLKKLCKKICQLISQNFCHICPAKTWWIECAKKLLFFTQNRQTNLRQKMFLCQFRSFLFCRTKYFFLTKKIPHFFPRFRTNADTFFGKRLPDKFATIYSLLWSKKWNFVCFNY